MQKPSLQTILINALIIVALFSSIYLPYKWKQLSNDFLNQTNQYGELLKQINDLQKEVRELKNGDGKIDDLKDWKTYNNPEADFIFKYPNDWEITDDYFYETAAGIKAKQKTVILQKIGNEDSNNWIRINPRQFQFDIGKDDMGKCVGNICTYSKNPEVLNILDKIAESFKKIEIDDFSNWKTYRNEEYGFEVKYPKDVKVWFSKHNYWWGFAYKYEEELREDFIVMVHNNPKNYSLKKWILENEICMVKKEETLAQIKEIVISGEKSIKITNPMGTCPPGGSSIKVKIYISHNSKVYTIEVQSGGAFGEKIKRERLKIFNQMLSTFKFIE